MFEIYSNPTIKIADLRCLRGFNIPFRRNIILKNKKHIVKNSIDVIILSGDQEIGRAQLGWTMKETSDGQ